MQRVIGIDFGTSTTYMNVKRYNNGKPVEDKFSYMPVMFNYGESSGFVMSIVRENSDGTFDFGEKAAEQLDGARVYTEFKMRLESPDEREREEARRLTREFFKFLYASYAQQASNLGSPDDTVETLVSYPVKWQADTARFMLDTAREVGFQNVRGIDEATAAVSTVLCQSADGSLFRGDKFGYLMLIDMGAGTTDLVVCRYQAQSDGSGIRVEMVTSWPQNSDEPTFGGREIDVALENYVEGYLSMALNPALVPQARVIAATPGQAKLWKERNVSANLGAGREVNTCAYISTYKTMGMLNGDFPAFGRKEFEKFIAVGLRSYANLLMGCLAKASACDGNFAASGLDLVILTGGHSAWYFAREIVDGTMAGYLNHPMLDTVRRDKSRVIGLPNPQSTVSLGLVYSKLPLHLPKAEPEPEPKAEPKPEPKPEPEETAAPSEAEDQYQLGLRYREGDGVARNLSEAVACFRRAAEQGDVEAQTELGICYAKGNGVAKDWTQAVKWFCMAAEQGSAIAQYNLGICYISGDGVARNLSEAVACFRRAAEQGNAEAQTELATYYVIGNGVAQDWTQAVKWFRMAADQGVTIAQYNLGICYKSGNGVAQDWTEAIKWFRKAADQGNPDAPAHLEELLRQIPARHYRWDDRLLSVIKTFFRTDPAFSSNNELKDTDKVNRMRMHFRMPVNDEYFHAQCWSGTSGKEGRLICASGIHIRQHQGGIFFGEYVYYNWSWQSFLDSEQYSTIRNDKLTFYFVAKDEKTPKLSFSSLEGVSMLKLRDDLREKAAALEAGSG